MAKQFWRLDRVQAETGLSRSAIYEEMDEGRFPKNFPITKRSVAWLSTDIEAWKVDRLKAAGKLMEAA
jgi:prophage regulatory protein